MKPVEPVLRLTGDSNVATRRREIPNMSKNSFQNVCASDLSLVAFCHEREKSRARCLISFHEMFGIDVHGTTGGCAVGAECGAERSRSRSLRDDNKKGKGNGRSRSLRDDNKKGKGKGNGKGRSRSLRDDNQRGNGNGKYRGPSTALEMTTREAKAQLRSMRKNWGVDFHKSASKPHLIKTLGEKVSGGRPPNQ
jgi:hypothetical protein